MLGMLFLIGTFGINYPIFISTMSVTVFHAGASQYGLLTSIMAVGSVVGALLSARREKPRMAFLLVGAVVFGLGFALAAFMPSYWLFGLALVVVGVAAQTFTTTAIGAVQLWTDPAMRGRVIAIVPRRRHGWHPAGRTSGRLGRGSVWPALGTGRRRGLGIRRRLRRDRLSREIRFVTPSFHESDGCPRQ